MFKPDKLLLTPENSAIIFIDHQPQMAFGVRSHDVQLLKNNVTALAKTARVFAVPTILSSVETESFSGFIWPELLEALEHQEPIERFSMNAWEDEKFHKAVKALKRDKLIFAALWTEVCLCMPVICALAEGYEVYFVSDASGGTSLEAHEMAISRMMQKGAIPLTWQQVLLEYQRDWARKDTYNQVIKIVQQHSGIYGMGIDYAMTLVHKKPARQG